MTLVMLGEFRHLHDYCSSCDACGELPLGHEPVGIAWLDNSWVRLVYVCPAGHRWTCGWSRDMGNPDAHADERDYIYGVWPAVVHHCSNGA